MTGGVVSDNDERGRAEAERIRRQRGRSIAIALALGGLVVLFYIATMIRLGGNVFNRAL
jgi:hypothetical protein